MVETLHTTYVWSYMEYASDEEEFDITPPPAVLITLTYNPLSWLDALCELIDNSLDSFAFARILGQPITQPRIELFIPSKSDVERGDGFFRIRDNGPGMDRKGLMTALTAALSTKGKYGTLGLFGVGFNIATGKIGSRTVVTTARKEDDFATEVILDLPALAEQETFRPENNRVPKPEGMEHGTRIEINQWWPVGNQNSDFAKAIASRSQNIVKENLGRRYATVLNPKNGETDIRLYLYATPESDPERVSGHEHCAWGENRFVKNNRFGIVKAQHHFNEVIGQTRRCKKDGTIAPHSSRLCQQCNGNEFESIEERVRGWVGIQRFDHTNNWGIDIIRNGRAILVGEKDAFFSRLDDLGRPIREYPVDDQLGRIVGEIHLDHVSVDFLKSNFERSTVEWANAMDFIRGKSLLPGQWETGYINESPVSRLHGAYKRVREYGRKSMYMGTWDPIRKKGKRISREIERDLYDKFLGKEKGYYDDAEWWKKVEEADTRPPPPSLECKECHYINPPEASECGGCGKLLASKECVSCEAQIPKAAVVCGHCGIEQDPTPPTPWPCAYCKYMNSKEDQECGQCGLGKNMLHPTSEEELNKSSALDDELTKKNWTVLLANGVPSEPLNLIVKRTSKELIPVWGEEPVPVVSYKGPGQVNSYIDATHPLFIDLKVQPELIAATEAAQYLFTLNGNLQGMAAHSVSNLASKILHHLWRDTLTLSETMLRTKITSLYETISERLYDSDEILDFYKEMSEPDQQQLAAKILSRERLEKLDELLESGRYISYLSPDQFVDFFTQTSDLWYREIWSDELLDPDTVGEDTAKTSRDHLTQHIARCLKDCALFINSPATTSDSELLERSISALGILEKRLR
jgi:hypothetical protein